MTRAVLIIYLNFPKQWYLYAETIIVPLSFLGHSVYVVWVLGVGVASFIHWSYKGMRIGTKNFNGTLQIITIMYTSLSLIANFFSLFLTLS